MARRRFAVGSAATALLLCSAMPAMSQQTPARRVVHPDDPAPTLMDDLAAISTPFNAGR